MKRKIRPTRKLNGVYPKYQPEVGKVYEAEHCPSGKRHGDFCIIDIKDKRIVLRKGEFEVVEE